MALSARAICDEIRANDETFRLFRSIAAKGEARGAWENARIAALTPDRHLAARLERRGIGLARTRLAEDRPLGDEELLRMVERGHGARVRAMLCAYALVEIRTYRDVSLAVMSRMGEALGWSAAKRAALAFGIRSIWAVERRFTWRRFVRLRPVRRDALGAPAQAAG
jgi:hypothetical protein